VAAILRGANRALYCISAAGASPPYPTSDEPGAAAGPQLGMITSDPPDHDRMRRIAMWHFGPPHTPDMVAAQEAKIRQIADDLLDNLESKERIDIVDEFAYPLPVTVICDILGVPKTDEPRFHGWIEAAMNGADCAPEATSQEQQRVAELGGRGSASIHQYLSELVDDYARQPGPGVLSAMINYAGSEERLTRGELISNALLLLFTGHETTDNLIAHSILIKCAIRMRSTSCGVDRS
jgi:cytochrome P450